MTSRIAGLWEGLMGWGYPAVCQICGAERGGPVNGYIGEHCLRQLKHVVPPFCDRCGLPFDGAVTHSFRCANCSDVDLAFSRARAAVVANPFMLDALHRYKYGRARWLEPWLGSLLVDAAAGEIRSEGWEVLIPVPLHSVREREREFNQAVNLARILGGAAGIPVVCNAVIRSAPTPTQTHLSRTERAANVRHAFSPSRGIGRVRGKRCIVIDDVLTTGATTSAVAAVLKAAEASGIMAWSVARAVF